MCMFVYVYHPLFPNKKIIDMANQITSTVKKKGRGINTRMAVVGARGELQAGRAHQGRPQKGHQDAWKSTKYACLKFRPTVIYHMTVSD